MSKAEIQENLVRMGHKIFEETCITTEMISNGRELRNRIDQLQKKKKLGRTTDIRGAEKDKK